MTDTDRRMTVSIYLLAVLLCFGCFNNGFLIYRDFNADTWALTPTFAALTPMGEDLHHDSLRALRMWHNDPSLPPHYYPPFAFIFLSLFQLIPFPIAYFLQILLLCGANLAALAVVLHAQRKAWDNSPMLQTVLMPVVFLVVALLLFTSDSFRFSL